MCVQEVQGASETLQYDRRLPGTASDLVAFEFQYRLDFSWVNSSFVAHEPKKHRTNVHCVGDTPQSIRFRVLVGPIQSVLSLSCFFWFD